MSALISYLVPEWDVKVAVLFCSWTMPLQRDAGHLLAVHSCSSKLLDCEELQKRMNKVAVNNTQKQTCLNILRESSSWLTPGSNLILARLCW